MDILLDSHVFLWMHYQPEKLSHSAKNYIQNANNRLFLSHASLWELQVKITLGKLNSNTPLSYVVKTQIQVNNLILLPISENHIYQLDLLPQYKEHSDPFDRMLISQSKIENMALLSADSKIHTHNYGITILW